MQKEQGIQLPHEYFLELAAKASKISIDDERVTIWQTAVDSGETDVREPSLKHFGNNFHLLFVAHGIKITNPDDKLVKIYLDRAEKLGRPWHSFIEENQELLSNIELSLEGIRLFNDLMDYCGDLLRMGKNVEADELINSVNHPLGIKAIGMLAWDNLNPLLEQAAEGMKTQGINPEEFFG